MSSAAEVVVGLVILVGLVGVVVPIIPGTLLILAAILLWALMTGGATAWTVFVLAALALVVTGVVKYTWPGQRMRDGGVPNLSVMIGGVVGIIGFFVVPVVGLFLGFVLGTYVAEWIRLRNFNIAWASTLHAVKAVGLSMVVELFGALVAAGLWLGAVVVV
ncbi:DUF456 domain-containing protein [Rhodococcus sp. ARC_M6]|uniref:DUF456 domain-containing protein n=1 Tax=Rhodococcus sp. ARC_M6 TaxID=2928852 RepID=UPI001FB52F2C|nr:DUF456 domain-containing protein [Rhodococcus sp. ARC_M6]MCJ0902231.1 DUF456 domain-containing protein [Rhodococcus sp. ARC_M6]